MSELLMKTHLPPQVYGKSVLFATLGHLLLFSVFVWGGDFLPRGEVVVLGTGLGGGQGGDFVTVGLSPELSGGTGMYKPALTPQPQAAPAAERPPAEERQEEIILPSKSAPAKKRAPRPSRAASQETPAAGQIPRQPSPGSGGSGGTASGSGGGFGGGQGVRIGPGTGEGEVESWYVRQVEQRIGRNWLKTSLGGLASPVQTVVSFEIQADGQIVEVHIDRASGIGSVDLAAERAVRATNPLPPLPLEFRRRRVKFVAHFEYPPQ